MAQLERPQRYSDSETNASHEQKNIIVSPTMEQYLRGGEVSRSSSTNSSSPAGNHDAEEDHGHHHKKSVLTKVKEKAKKLKHSLSNKKKHHEGDNTTPSWGVSLNEYEDEEEDAEYLGAPMYESEMAPKGYKETARQHPRANPVIPENHVLPSSVNKGSEQDKEKTPSPNKTVIETVSPANIPPSPNETVPETVAAKPPSPAKTVTETVAVTKSTPSPRKTITETVTEKLGPAFNTVSEKLGPAYATVSEKLGPAYATVSDATHAIASKIESLTVSPSVPTKKQGLTVAAPPPSANCKATPAPQALSASAVPHSSSAEAADAQAQQPLSAPAPGKHVGSAEQIWDKGVSVKEYLIQKFEPGEDERALSQVISDAMSPRKAPGDAGMVEKVKGAITSLLRNEEPSKTSTTSQSAMASSPRIPISTNAYEAVEEENQGRILQTN